ncbi:MAG: DUF2511 domain-containing protein [Methylophilaceae bacterium]
MNSNESSQPIYETSQRAEDIVNSTRLSKEEFGDKWPVSVGSGTVACIANSVVFEADGKLYAVNGIAKGEAEKYGYANIEDIWLDDPEFFKLVEGVAKVKGVPVEEVAKTMGEPTKIGIGPILDAGVSLCN